MRVRRCKALLDLIQRWQSYKLFLKWQKLELSGSVVGEWWGEVWKC